MSGSCWGIVDVVCVWVADLLSTQLLHWRLCLRCAKDAGWRMLLVCCVVAGLPWRPCGVRLGRSPVLPSHVHCARAAAWLAATKGCVAAVGCLDSLPPRVPR